MVCRRPSRAACKFLGTVVGRQRRSAAGLTLHECALPRECRFRRDIGTIRHNRGHLCRGCWFDLGGRAAFAGELPGRIVEHPRTAGELLCATRTLQASAGAFNVGSVGRPAYALRFCNRFHRAKANDRDGKTSQKTRQRSYSIGHDKLLQRFGDPAYFGLAPRELVHSLRICPLVRFHK